MLTFEDYGNSNAVLSPPTKTPNENEIEAEILTEEQKKAKEKEEYGNTFIGKLEKTLSKSDEEKEYLNDPYGIRRLKQDQRNAEEKLKKEEEEKNRLLEEKEAKELKHIEDREDSAYQTAIEDMRKGGWNVDALTTPQAAPVGARLDSTRSENKKDRDEEMKRLLKQLEVAIAEGNKNRVTQIIGDILGTFKIVQKI